MSIISASATFAGQSAAKIATLARLEGLEASTPAPQSCAPNNFNTGAEHAA